MHVARVNVVAASHTTPFHEHSRAIREDVLDGVVVEILVHVRPAFGILLVMARPHSLRFNRPVILHPAEVIDDVDVEIAKRPAAGPEKAMETPDLPEQLTRFTGPFFRKG